MFAATAASSTESLEGKLQDLTNRPSRVKRDTPKPNAISTACFNLQWLRESAACAAGKSAADEQRKNAARGMRQQRDRLAPSHDLAKAINYILSRWVAFTRFLGDGRICLSGSDSGGHRAAAAYTLIETCKLNDVDPQAWLADVLARLPDHPAIRIAELLMWNWKAARLAIAA